MSLYIDLYRCRPEAHRSRLEDFLSTALVDLLNRLPKQLMWQVTGSLFIPGAARAAWLSYASERERMKLYWRAFQTINHNGRCYFPDMLLEADGTPLLIVENKIAAPFLTHRAPRDAGSRRKLKANHQLEIYGQWLRKQSRPGDWEGAIATLTHFTPSPADFGNGDTKYGVRLQVACRWRQVSRALSEMVNSNLRDREDARAAEPLPTWHCLAAELLEFLEEHGMHAEQMTRRDLEALKEFLPHADRIGEAFNGIYEHIRGRLRSLNTRAIRRKTGAVGAFPDAFLHVARDYVEFMAPALKNWYLEWGISSPGAPWIDTFAARGVTFPQNQFFAYVGIFASTGDGARLLTLSEVPHRPDSWQCADPLRTDEDECGLVAIRSIDDLGDTDDLPKVLGEWVARELDAAAPIVEVIAKRSGKANGLVKSQVRRGSDIQVFEKQAHSRSSRPSRVGRRSR